MIDLAPIAELLEHLGIKHAPKQRFAPPELGSEQQLFILNSRSRRAKQSADPEIDGRYVTLRDPPGVYYILGTDNADRREKLTEEVMLIFLGVPDDKMEHYAGSIGYKLKEIRPLPSEIGPIPSVILEPKHPSHVAST